MDVYLDNEPLVISEPTVASAIDVAKSGAASRGRIVIEIHADGSPLPPGVIDEPPADDQGVGELRFVSAAPGPFVRETLAEASDALGSVQGDRREAAEQIQSGSVSGAIEPLQRVLATWSVVGDVLQRSGAMIGIDVAQISVPETGDQSATTGEACIEELAGKLSELKAALSGQDWGGVSDLLAYEMDGLTDRWRALLDEVARQAVGEG